LWDHFGGWFVLTKRQFVIGASALVSSSLMSVRQAKPDVPPPPLPVPKLVDAAQSGHAVKLTVRSGWHAFVRGKPTRTYGYSAPVLGPVIRVRRGDEVQMTVENRLDRATTTNWHGLLVPGRLDGGPHQPIRPGGTWRPVLKIDQPAATAWYHPHPHHDTGRQVYMGRSGMLIIEDETSLRLDLPRTYGLDDLPIILQDRSFAPDGSLDYDPSPLEIAYGSRGDTIVVNGAIAPVARVPRGLVRLRILDGANARNFDLRFSDRRTYHVIATDTGFLAEPVAVSELAISPGERFEILVDFSDGQPVTLQTGSDPQIGAFDPLIENFAEPKDVPVMRFEPTAEAAAVKALPERLVEPAAADPGRAAARRRFVLDCSMLPGHGVHGAMGMSMTINGKSQDLARIDAGVKLGTSEVREIVSQRTAHAFHTHGASFRVLSINDQPPPAHLTGWKDVVLVQDHAELLVAFAQPASRQHPFMFHCHILEHEDAGLRGQYACT
jgi:FtsP/CotA-like multicopper oxidase with cupredoxin domain